MSAKMNSHKELFRLTIPEMSKNGIATTPENYAVWYTHMSGENPSLSQTIETLNNKKIKFTADVNHKLYNNFVSRCNIDKLSSARKLISNIVSDVGDKLEHANESVASFGNTLTSITQNIDDTEDPNALREIIGSLLHATQEMQDNSKGLHHDFEQKNIEINTLRKELSALKKQATTDPLTKLNNRLKLNTELDKALKNTITNGTKLSFLMCDIDHFKRINDTHGHIVGDRVICFIATTLKKQEQQAAIAARYGGEEFAVIFPGTSLDTAKKHADIIRKEVEDASLVRADNKQPIGNITLSLGISEYMPGDDADSLINRADQALYHAKNNGRNRVSTERALKDCT